MSFVKIPVRNDIFNYSMRVELDLFIYVLSFRYNQRIDSWFMDIADEQSINLLDGIQLQSGIPLKLGMIDSRLPVDDFYCIDINGKNTDPNLINFGNDVTLIYGK